MNRRACAIHPAATSPDDECMDEIATNSEFAPPADRVTAAVQMLQELDAAEVERRIVELRALDKALCTLLRSLKARKAAARRTSRKGGAQ